MSRLEFDGMKHEITLYNSKEEIVGTWEAQNNIDHIVKDMRHLPNKSYIVQDQHSPHRHNTPGVDTADGEYGTCGIVRFYTPKTPYNERHEGVGVHAGREHYYRRPGPQHPTKGCIRTTEEAMKAITKLMQSDALQTVTVKNNMFKGKK